MKKNVLIMAGYYVPSVKGGGPIQSIKNLVDNLSDEFNFYIVTADRDLGDDKPFKNIKTNTWVKVGKANVYYTNNRLMTWYKMKALLNSINYDVLYLNSFFSYKSSIMPVILKRLKLLPNKRIVLAPRGEFSEGALGLKSLKKKLYIYISKIFKLYNTVKWHATTEYELEDIKNVFGERIHIVTAQNLTADYQHVLYSKSIVKKPGEIVLVYVSRIHPMKNLLQVLKLIRNLEGKIILNIFGPIEDTQYWEKCNEAIENMPSNIKVIYYGPIQNDKLHEIYQEQHYFILLTLGENFGHAIAEALIGGCPVIISNRTPWKDLEVHRVGWDISLENEVQFLRVLKNLIAQDNEEYRVLSKNAYKFSKAKSNQDKELDAYSGIFMK